MKIIGAVPIHDIVYMFRLFIADGAAWSRAGAAYRRIHWINALYRLMSIYWWGVRV